MFVELNVKKILAVQLTQLMQLRKESLKKSGLPASLIFLGFLFATA